jgi:oxygen-independent coproporphyrinogen-3 oxidase
MMEQNPTATRDNNLNRVVTQARRALTPYRRLQTAGLIHREGSFYPSVHYPPITMYPNMGADEVLEGWKLRPEGLLDVYVHIPFCVRKCDFCHYPVKAGKDLDERDRYLDTLRDEMDIWLRRTGLERIPVRSVLVGGGTPTHLTPKQLDRFLTEFCARLDRSTMTQFNFDVDPSTVLGPEGRERMNLLKAHGVDRITFGIQSLDDPTLHRMNRPHDAAGAKEAVTLSMKMGFTTNIEFIFGYPGQTVHGWTSMMQEAIELETDEIQLYRLKIEPYGDGEGRILRLASEGRTNWPSADESIQMKAAARILLNEAGYHETLSRVYSRRPEIYSHYAHNQCCDLLEQVGFGQTAFSSLRDRFSINTQSLPEYYKTVASGELPITRGLRRDSDEQARWSFLLPLKARNVVKSRFLEQTGKTVDELFGEKLNTLKEFGLLEESTGELGLTELGRFYAEEIAHQFHSEEHIPFPTECYEDGPLHPHRNPALVAGMV